MPNASPDLSRRGFIAALVSACTALALPKEKIYPAGSKINVKIVGANPVLPIDWRAWCYRKQTTILQASEYTLLDVKPEEDFCLRGMRIAWDPSCSLRTLTAFLGENGEGAPGGYQASLTVGSSERDPKCYLRTPVMQMPFGDRLTIVPEILIPKGSVIRLTCEGDYDLPEPLRIEVLFDGIHVARPRVSRLPGSRLEC